MSTTQKLRFSLNKEKTKNEKLEQLNRGLRLKYKQIKEQKDELSKQIKEQKDESTKQIIEKKINPVTTQVNTSDATSELRSIVLNSILDNLDESPNRYRYPDQVYEFSKVLSNLCTKCYETSRNVLIFPNNIMINDHFEEDEKKLIKEIQDVNKTDVIIIRYKNIYKIEDDLDCILAVDAASLDRPNKKSDSYMFVFYVQPINRNYKCFPIFMQSNRNSNCNDQIKINTNKIIENLRKFNIFVKAVATDGDSSYNTNASETFSVYIKNLEENVFFSAVESIQTSTNVILYISDFLHLLKLARKRIIKCSVTIRTQLKHIFNYNSLEKFLNLGIALNDISSISFMKDYYPLQIFSIENSLIIIR